jgi:hypothetical protein
MNHAQRAQALDQHQLARIESRELRVALEQCASCSLISRREPGQQHPQILDRRAHQAIVEIDEVRPASVHSTLPR